MTTRRLWALTFLGLAAAGCATYGRPGRPTTEVDRLEDLATHVLKLDLGKVEKRGAERNMAGLRSQHVLFSERLDSRTYFVQDDRFQVDQGGEAFQGTDEELIHLARQILGKLAIPAEEIASAAVLTEKETTAHLDPGARVYVPAPVRSGRRFVELSRSLVGVPVFSSRALIGLKGDRSIGFIEAHWPEIPAATLREAQNLRELIQRGWRPPAQSGATVESVEAGIIHSPALGFVMDVYPVIRVIYAAEDRSVGRKAVLYLDRNGKTVPAPRTFEKTDQPPASSRRGASGSVVRNLR